jgi:hypothetical protein
MNNGRIGVEPPTTGFPPAHPEKGDGAKPVLLPASRASARPEQHPRDGGKPSILPR